MLTIRTTTRADLAEVDALLARAFPKLLKADYPPSVLVTALPLISRAQPALLGSGTYYAVLLEGRIVGVGGWSRDRGIAERGHVRHVATDAGQVRRGIGRALMTHVAAQARAAGMRELECWATRTAVPFYASVGFVEEGPMEVTLQPGITFPSVRMRLGLAEGGRAV
ncbi:GNAT family N-acetyltransferase [Seohaeicola zhoushanensis]|uniref:N-acetyltransferase n=1 Tax=Seohaeicola zhoushanensis TaxID=1569283 RepID=A0A8J3M3A8_9RHOB|nr:GNAT family N-acetyltransferase [Seohaeicola zhoushanensis]GHF32813.1 N-acetyltransferase [Seohaeicola zhoushanensis]